MRLLRAVSMRLGELFGKGRRDRELEAELESHVQMHADENVRVGMAPEEARRPLFPRQEEFRAEHIKGPD